MITLEQLNAVGKGKLPGLLGLEITLVEPRRVAAQLAIRPDHLAPNGYLHAGTVVALADTACGYGVMATLPEGGSGFATIELKTNFIGTVREGMIRCEARLAHEGRTTQLWDAEVCDGATGKAVALFRCTQMILYARA